MGEKIANGTRDAASRSDRLRSWLPHVAAVGFWILVWQLASMAMGSAVILAGPLEVAGALMRDLAAPAFWGQIAFSGARILGGAAAGYAAAFALAAASRQWPLVRILLKPPLATIKGAPIACLIVLLLIWFGAGAVSMAAVFLVVLPALYFPLLEGLDQLDPDREEFADAYGLGGVRRLLALTWPGVLPYVRAASETALGMSWKAGIAAELIGVPTGSIGERIYQCKILLDTPDLFAWTIVIVAVSWICERLLLRVLDASERASIRLALRMPQRVRTDTLTDITVTDLSVGYGAACTAPYSFAIAPGETLCVRGPSGAGKTTLLRTLAGRIPAQGGSIDPAPAAPCAFVFQDTRLIEQASARENVLLTADHGIGTHAAVALLTELLPADVLDRPVSELSGGQRRRVEIARALAAPSSPLIFDEPFTGLDAQARERAIAAIERHRAGRPLIIASHDGADAAAFGARELVVEPLSATTTQQAAR